MAEELPKAALILGAAPDAAELSRLVQHYRTYEWEHRNALLYGYFQGRTVSELVQDKLYAKGINPKSCTSRSLGGHGRWVRKKVKKAFVRILYLRYRLDEHLTQREANRRLFEEDKTKSGLGQSAIRKITHCPLLDGK
jgi:hypothetical protein